jgi:mono/diheme cytochrome c family protein
MSRKLRILLLLCLGIDCVALAQSNITPSRGELLYATHCSDCHTTQLHWRAKKLATNWLRLKAEVDRWQKSAGLGWRDDEVTDVARYLNSRYYHFALPVAGQSPKVSPTRLSRQQD